MQNHGDSPFNVRLSIAFASDFADLFEVRGMHRERRGAATVDIGMAEVALKYQGLDGVQRCTSLLFEPTPAQLSGSAASYDFNLQPNECLSVYVTVKCDQHAAENITLPFRRALRAAFNQRLPGEYNASEPRYKIKSEAEGFERVVAESALDSRFVDAHAWKLMPKIKNGLPQKPRNSRLR